MGTKNDYIGRKTIGFYNGHACEVSSVYPSCYRYIVDSDGDLRTIYWNGIRGNKIRCTWHSTGGAYCGELDGRSQGNWLNIDSVAVDYLWTWVDQFCQSGSWVALSGGTRLAGKLGSNWPDFLVCRTAVKAVILQITSIADVVYYRDGDAYNKLGYDNETGEKVYRYGEPTDCMGSLNQLIAAGKTFNN